MPQIVRLTLLKIPDAADVEAAKTKYETLSQDAVKDGKQYIKFAQAIPTLEDARSQGYTVVARTAFDSKEDMDFYDNECPAHLQIKALLKGKVAAPPLVVYVDAQDWK